MLFRRPKTDADIYKVVSVTVAAEVDEVRPEAIGALREEEEAVVSQGSRGARRSLL
jgi:hypothetical protein